MANIVEKVIDEDLDTNVKLLELSKKKFQTKVNENTYSSITLCHVELTTKIDVMKNILENILSLYTKLCDAPLFTQEV